VPILPQGLHDRASPPGHRRPIRLTPYLFILPFVSIFVAMRLGPAIFSLLMSLTNWRGVTVPEFIGLRNFAYMAQDTQLHIALQNTTLYTLLSVPLLLGGGLVLALLLNQRLPGRSLGRMAAFTPYVLMSTVVGVLWVWMLERDFGLLNVFLGTRIPWLLSKDWAMPSVVLASVWWTVGYNMVLFLAGLQEIPEELYEAARIDGAGRLQTFWRVTWPMLAPTTFLALLLTLTRSFQVFDQVFVMTGGGPGTATLTVVQYLYLVAFTQYKFGYGSAIAVGLLLLLLTLTLLLRWWNRRGYEGVDL